MKLFGLMTSFMELFNETFNGSRWSHQFNNVLNREEQYIYIYL